MSVVKTSKFSVLNFGEAVASSDAKTASTSEPSTAGLLDALSAHGIKFSLHEHVAAFTVEEQAKVVGHLPGVLTKNLFIKDKKYGFYLITTAAGVINIIPMLSYVHILSNELYRQRCQPQKRRCHAKLGRS
jgi:hypothetical protein